MLWELCISLILQETIAGFKKIINGRQLLLPFHHLVFSMRLHLSPSPPLPPLPLSPLFPSPLLTGELDDIPGVAFDMVGTIEEVVRNTEQLAAQQQQ